MILSHWSASPLGALYPVEQHGSDLKPRGLWLSVDGEQDWPTWCRDNEFRDDNAFMHRAVITLKPDAEVLFLQCEREVLEFTERYGYNPLPGHELLADTGMFIDWIRVAQEWHGLMVPTYLWSMRMHHRTSWYYGWDCASGCIWNPEAIDNVVQVT